MINEQFIEEAGIRSLAVTKRFVRTGTSMFVPAFTVVWSCMDTVHPDGDEGHGSLAMEFSWFGPPGGINEAILHVDDVHFFWRNGEFADGRKDLLADVDSLLEYWSKADTHIQPFHRELLEVADGHRSPDSTCGDLLRRSDGTLHRVVVRTAGRDLNRVSAAIMSMAEDPYLGSWMDWRTEFSLADLPATAADCRSGAIADVVRMRLVDAGADVSVERGRRETTSAGTDDD